MDRLAVTNSPDTSLYERFRIATITAHSEVGLLVHEAADSLAHAGPSLNDPRRIWRVRGHKLFSPFPYCGAISAGLDAAGRPNAGTLDALAGTAGARRSLEYRSTGQIADMLRAAARLVEQTSSQPSHIAPQAIELALAWKELADQLATTDDVKLPRPTSPAVSWTEPQFAPSEFANAVAVENAAVHYLARESIAMRQLDPKLDDALRCAMTQRRDVLRDYQEAFWSVLRDETPLSEFCENSEFSGQLLSEILLEFLSHEKNPEIATALDLIRRTGPSPLGCRFAGDLAERLAAALKRWPEPMSERKRAVVDSIALICCALHSSESLDNDAVLLHQTLNGMPTIPSGEDALTLGQALMRLLDYTDTELGGTPDSDLRAVVDGIRIDTAGGTLDGAKGQARLLARLPKCLNSCNLALFAAEQRNHPQETSIFGSIRTLIHNLCVQPGLVPQICTSFK